MNIERGPRKERGFVIVDNALAQNNRLSFGARGLAEYLLSLPPGARVDIRSLAADNPEGRDAIAGYMNELEAERYLVRASSQGERGRFITKTTIHEEPQDPSSLPTSLPKPWSKAKARRERGHLAAVQESSEFSQVGPNPAPPDFGGPTSGPPGAGGPDVGETGVNPYGVKETGGSTSSSPVREDADAPTGLKDDQAEGGGGDAPQQQEEHPAAAAFVDCLPYRGRLPGPRQRKHLIQRVSAALAAGWSENKLRIQMTEETDSAKSLAAVYRHRLAPENLPAAPPLPKPRTGDDVQLSEASGSLYVKCQGPACGRKMLPTPDGLCRECREDVTA